MDNWFDFIRSQLHFRQFQIGDQLFAEYTCPIPVKELSVWSDHDCLVHVLSGRKIWRTDKGEWIGDAGKTLYFKKGCYVVEQFFEDDFCLFCFTIPDALIHQTIQELGGDLKHSGNEALEAPATYIEQEPAIRAYIQSIRTYFASTESPPEPLLKLKVKELITSVLLSRNNKELAAYLVQVSTRGTPDIAQAMEMNFRYNLSIEDFARMCNRSLSSFKRDFQKAMGEPPGKWLRQRRIRNGAQLLKHSELSVTEIAFESGFEDVSHFCKLFKTTYGCTAGDYRQEHALTG